MGRKIPAKKHRGVKDPLEQQAKRLKSLKGKINAPPKDPDEQPVPHSLTRLFAFQDKKSDINKKKKTVRKHDKSRSSDSHKGGRNQISQMRRLPGESGRSFSLRINSAIKAINEPTDQIDYPLDMEAEEDATGSRMEEQRRRRARKRRQGAGGGAGGGGGGEAAVPARVRRLAMKKEAKILKENELKAEAREVVYERVGFGEVAHAPPALPPPRGARGARGERGERGQRAGGGAARPGRRELLLTGLLQGAAAGAGAGEGGAGRAGVRARQLPAAERRRRERARQDAVDAYRAVKAAAHKERSNKPAANAVQ